MQGPGFRRGVSGHWTVGVSGPRGVPVTGSHRFKSECLQWAFEAIHGEGWLTAKASRRGEACEASWEDSQTGQISEMEKVQTGGHVYCPGHSAWRYTRAWSSHVLAATVALL